MKYFDVHVFLYILLWLLQWKCCALYIIFIVDSRTSYVKIHCMLILCCGFDCNYQVQMVLNCYCNCVHFHKHLDVGYSNV